MKVKLKVLKTHELETPQIGRNGEWKPEKWIRGNTGLPLRSKRL